MTVQDLIEHLKKFDGQLQVAVPGVAYNDGLEVSPKTIEIESFWVNADCPGCYNYNQGSGDSKMIDVLVIR